MPTYTSACPRNCYSTCGLELTVEDGRLRAIAGHPDCLATAEGPCLKGLAYVERVVSPDRILRPLARGEDGVHRPVSWDEALSQIVERLEPLRATSLQQSLFYYAGSGTKGLLNSCGEAFWRSFGGYTTTYGDLCWPAGLEATRLTLGANLHNAPEDLAAAKLIVFWGKNPAETNVHQMVFVDQARRRGARVVVIDPRRTETAERADLLIQPRPGTDAALALAVAQVLIADDKTDRAFLRAHALGYDEFAARAAEWPPARAAELCGVPVEQIRELAALLGLVKPATINAGFGMQRFSNGGQTMRAILALVALTGNLGKPGAGWVFANLQTDVFGAEQDPLAFYPPAAPDGIARVSVSTARLGPDLLAQTGPPVRMAWIERGNPACQNPETGAVLAALRALDFVVVVDQFLTDTAREADLVLPAKTLFEQSDVIGAYWHGSLQLKQKVLEPPGEVKPETEVYRELGARLGLALGDALPRAGDAGVEAWLQARMDPLGLSLEQLRQGPVPVPGYRAVAFEDLRFPTPSGKIELLSAEAAARWGVDPLPGFVELVEAPAAADAGPAGRLQLLTPNTKDRIHSQFGNLRMIQALGAGPAVEIHPADAAARGIADGVRVAVSNPRGRLVLPARWNGGLRRGCVSIFNGVWGQEGGPVNLLSPARETDLGHGAAFHDVLVEVEPARD